MRVAIAQFTANLDPGVNREEVRKLTADAASGGAELVVFPEAAARDFGRPGEPLAPVAEPLDGPFFGTLEHLAGKHRLVMVAGMLESIPGDSRVYNTVIAVGPDGGLLGAYRKLHLFDAFGYRESATIRPGGGDTLVFPHGDLRFGVLTCYDLRFPELARELVDQGAEVLLVPAAWVHGPLKEDHWMTLARARAIENTSYLMGSGQVGNNYCGRSLVVDPLGVAIAALGDRPGVAVAEISAERVVEARDRVPSLRHRRFSVRLREEPPG
ncbi:MAG TPA: carbon-nitrogen hydrolase family protein [Actinomycetes bacterium]